MFFVHDRNSPDIWVGAIFVPSRTGFQETQQQNLRSRLFKCSFDPLDFL